MKKLLLAAACLPLLMACGQGSGDGAGTEAADKTETGRLNVWFDETYEELLQQSPIQMTRLGRNDRQAEWDDMSQRGEAARREWFAEKTREMQDRFDYAALDTEGKLSFDLWVHQNEMRQAEAQFLDHRYIFTQMFGMHTQIPTFLINLHDVETREDIDAYVARIEAVETLMGQLVDQMRRNAEAGVRPPRFAYEMVLDQAQEVLRGRPFTQGTDNPLYRDAVRKIANLQATDIITPQDAGFLREAVRDVMVNHYGVGYQELITFLREDLPNTDEVAAGVGGLPQGEAYYQERLAAQTTTDLTPEEIHEIGLAEVARLRAEMEAVMGQVEFDGTLEEFFVELREAPWNYYPNTDAGRQAYIDDATAAIENIEGQLADLFGVMPKADLTVKRVEPYREQDGGAQHYVAGTPDGSRAGIYYAHLSDMSAMPKNQLEVIAYHEGLPGHHMQISIAQELEGIPTFRTQYNTAAYAEGWALYSELLAKEVPGTYADPYADFGRLTTEMWRAIRLVVDTGLHAKGWSEDEAVAYFMANSPEPLESVQSEVRRYLVLPGQATSYKIGMLKIQELRAEAEGRLGERFDIRAFHDAVLGGGALPLPLLERRVMTWVKATEDAIGPETPTGGMR